MTQFGFITEETSTVQRAKASVRGTECCTILRVIYTLQEHYGWVPNYFNPLIHQRYLEVIDLFCCTP